jgi:8-oxo-dGTP pyrophosphatase MutT (NUDIX family)
MVKRVFTQTFGVVGAILEKDGKVLLMREASSGKGIDSGKWSHPAGWIDVGEDPIVAAKREVLEESGYELEPTALLGVYSLVREDAKEALGIAPQGIKLIFIGKLLNKVPHELSEDSAETKWFTPEEIYKMDSNTLRDVDIKQMVKDYFKNQSFDLSSITHTVQN